VWPRVFILILVLAPCNELAWAGPNYHGRVLRVKPGELVVTIGTEEFEFVVTSRTRIEMEGKPARLEAVRKGSVAAVEAERLGDVRIARRILVRGKPRPAGGVRATDGHSGEEVVPSTREYPVSRESPASGSHNPTPRSDLNLDRR
jgi:hypothetical protein